MVGNTAYVPQKKFWIIVLLAQCSVASHVFAWAAFLTLSTLVGNEDS